MYLADLRESHALRNKPLRGAFYRQQGAKRWREVFASFKIAKVTYNQLGKVWTDKHEWKFKDTTA